MVWICSNFTKTVVWVVNVVTVKIAVTLVLILTDVSLCKVNQNTIASSYVALLGNDFGLAVKCMIKIMYKWLLRVHDVKVWLDAE